MPMSVLLVALVLVMSGLGSFVMGLSLMPTDMSRAWLVVGATLFSGGMVSLALGFAARNIIAALRAGIQPVAPREPQGAGAPLAPEPFAQTAETETPSSAAQAGLGHAGLVAVGGAVLGAGVLAAHATEAPRGGHETAIPDTAAPDMLAPASADEFERELFALREPEMIAVAPVAASALELPGGELPEPELPEHELRLTPALAEPETPGGDDAEPEVDAGAQAHAPVPEPDAQPDTPPDDKEGVAASDDIEPEDHAQQPVAPPAVAGLIADDDLAALQASEPPLAPLETLDIVGAYDSGGVRFTMYSDGSVHAAGPGGEHRYRSLEALRKRLDAGLPAV